VLPDPRVIRVIQDLEEIKVIEGMPVQMPPMGLMERRESEVAKEILEMMVIEVCTFEGKIICTILDHFRVAYIQEHIY
jgi:hypothetical protein